HGMGWGVQHGNMCNDGRPKPFNEDWPDIGSKLYREEFKKGNCPYNEGASFLDPWFFSREYMNQPNPEDHVIKDGVLYIGDRSPYTDSFKNKTDFTKVVIPSSVGSINGSAFYGTAIKEFTIPPSVVVIGDSAFQDCSDLRYIEIPDNVRELGDGSFQNCPQLREAKIGKGLRKLNQKLFKGSGLKEITVPKNIRLIDKETFQDCKNLKKVVIEDGVRKIGDNAFGNTALTEITFPDSVTMFGKNITSKSVVWNVKPGTAAYEYAKEIKYKIKLPQEDMNMIAAKLLAECKNAVEAPADKWDTDTIAAYDDRRKWDFSSALKGSGEYIVTFTYTGGKSGLMLTDTLVAADGKVAAYFPESRFAGTNSKQIIYSFNVPSGTKKLEMYSFPKRDGGKSSSGNVSVRSVADYSAKILSECADSEPLSSDGWEDGAFTQDDVRRRWDFSDKINGTNGGDYIIRFSYIEGSDTLRLTDSLFIADGKSIRYFPEMKSVGSNSSDAAFNITVPQGTKKIEMLSLARAGKSDNSGIISVLMEDDGTLEGITARIMAENANPKSAPTDKWDKDTFSTKNVRRKWDFSSALKGGGDYVVSFTYTSGNKSLCLSDSLFLADGKPLAHYSARQVAGKDTVNIVFRLNVPKGTKKLELYANAKKDGKGDTGGIVSVETMDNKAKKVLAEGKKYKRGPLEWDKNYFTDEYVYYKWDITTLMMKDNEYSDTYMSGDYSLIFSSGVNLADVMVFADDKMISYHPDVRKFTNNTSAPYDITVPDGTKKLELYGLIKGSAAGKVTMEKGE
ncbi:MAG: leucine-rich repeat domain-containing protein, partial [Spirochaetales bacterium]|nr:leucine-rich repeat domain-containing protein [Spirochaetales bacterium]